MKLFKSLRVAGLTAIAGAVFFAASARAQIIVDPVSQVTVTNIALPSQVTTNSTSNLVQQVFYMNPGYDLGLESSLLGGSQATTLSNGVWTVKFGNDRTNWPISFNWTNNIGTVTTIAGTNVPYWYFDGFRYAYVASFKLLDTNNSLNLTNTFTNYFRMSRKSIIPNITIP